MPTWATMTQWRPITTLWRDLDQIIDLGALADHRVAAGAAVDRGVGADLDVVLDDDAADLRHLQVPLRPHGEAEAVLPDAHAGMEDDAVADEARGRRSRSAPIEQSRPIFTCGPITRMGADEGAGADFGRRSDDGAGIDRDAVLQPRRGMDEGAGRNSRRRRRSDPGRMADGKQQRQNLREDAIGLRRDDRDACRAGTLAAKRGVTRQAPARVAPRRSRKRGLSI